jgi:uncharacterized membrane protein YkvA (DUF1232 family)
MATVAGIAAGLLATYLVLLVVLARARPDGATAREVVRLLPDLVRLVARLARDRTLPRRARIRLWLLLGYLASPIDLVPDVVPVVGYLDDAILVAATLRSVVRAAGLARVADHWPGTADGFAAVARLSGLARAEAAT